VPEREKADLLHAGNLVMSGVVCDPSTKRMFVNRPQSANCL
jgi:hypothetical protein